MKAKNFLLFLSLLFSTQMFGQTPTWTAFTTAGTSNQLCNHDVQVIKSDEKGNIWFGTWGGLSKFDGTNWANFDVSDGLCYYQINCIGFDAESNGWFGTWGGLSKFDGINWTTYTRGTTNNQFEGEWVFAIVIDSTGNKWLGTVAGIYKFDGVNFTRYPLDQSYGMIKTMIADSNFNLWCGTNNGHIAIFNGSQWTYLTNSDLVGNSISSIVIDNKGTKWICSAGGGVFKFDGTNWTRYTTADGLINDNVTSMAIDSYGNKWFTSWGQDGGISKFSDSGWTTYNKSNSGLAINYVSTVFIDSSGNKWFGTYDGVSKFDGNTWISLHSNGLADNSINKVIIDHQGSKWFATDYGFSKFDGSIWTNYGINNGLIGETNSGGSMAIDSSGNKWFGTYYGLSKFDGTNWTNYNTSNSGLPCDAIYTIEVNPNGNLWFGFGWHYGVTKFDGINWATFTTYNSGLANDSVTSITFDKMGNIWFGTFGGGVSKFNGTSWMTFNMSNSGLVNNDIYSIFCDNVGNIWIGTYGDATYTGGVSKFDGTNWTTYLTQFSETFYSITQDKEGNIWAGSANSGVFKFDGTNWTNYSHGGIHPGGINNGFFNNEFGAAQSVPSISIDQKGDKWFGTRGGVSKLSYTDSVLFIITPQYQTVSKISGTCSFRVSSNAFWTDTCMSNWCTIVPFRTGGNETILVDYKANNLDSARNTQILINVEGLDSQQATLTQKGRIDGVTEVGIGNIRVYPNPVKDKFTLELSNVTKDLHLLISNITGNEVIDRRISDNKSLIDISPLPSGVYFLRLINENVIEVGKIIKE